MKTKILVAHVATTQEKIDMVMAIVFILSLSIRAYYSPYHY